jgi:RimJ/RimL family protein N-acetyltransferase
MGDRRTFVIVYDDKERCSEFIQRQLDQKVCWGEWYEAIGFVHDGEMIAAALYNYMTEFDCAMHFAASKPHWMQGDFINVIFRYPFKQMDLRRVTSYTWADNANALRLVRAFGFVDEGILRDAGGTVDKPVDVIVLGLLRKDCQYGR